MLKAIVLGGTDDHIALIENLHNRGYYTILIDYHNDPPARAYADLHIRESTLENERVLEIARGLDVNLVISTCIDQALLTVCYVAEKLRLPAPFSYEVAQNVTNKALMKEILVRAGIPTASYYKITDIQDVNKFHNKYPLVVKPADSNGSFGVRKVFNDNELLHETHKALEISRTHSAIIETYLGGQEISIDAFAVNGKVSVLMKSELMKVQNAGRGFQIYKSIYPAELSLKANESIRTIGNQIVQAFQLINTPLIIQAIVEQDNVTIVEFGARIGGGSKCRSIQRVTGFNILDAYVNTFLGTKPKILLKPSSQCYSRYHIYAMPGIFGEVKNDRQLKDEGVIEEFVLYKTKGMEIGSNMASRDRIGSFLVKGENKQELLNKIKTAVERLEVYNTKGDAIMRKDIV